MELCWRDLSWLVESGPGGSHMNAPSPVTSGSELGLRSGLLLIGSAWNQERHLNVAVGRSKRWRNGVHSDLKARQNASQRHYLHPCIEPCCFLSYIKKRTSKSSCEPLHTRSLLVSSCHPNKIRISLKVRLAAGVGVHVKIGVRRVRTCPGCTQPMCICDTTDNGLFHTCTTSSTLTLTPAL